MNSKPIKKILSSAFKFVLFVGVVNMFADMAYEGARSINGAFLASLGASALIVSIVGGLGEFLGYSLRSAAGLIDDKTKKYWTITIIGFFINMLAIPALALAGNWPMAAALIILERTGRAIRKPSSETMLSFASKKIGSGRVFGIYTAFDQLGGTIGPIIVAFSLFIQGAYKNAYAFLLIPAILCLISLFIAKNYFPHPEKLEEQQQNYIPVKNFSSRFWFLVAAGALIAAGLTDFSLIAYYFHSTNIIPNQFIPVLYIIVMAVDGIASFILGKLFDKSIIKTVLISFFISSFAAFFAFSTNLYLISLGMLLLGIGLASQDTLLKAIIPTLTEKEKRATAFGVFYLGYGIAWLAGNILMGAFYTINISYAVAFSAIIQLLALPIFFIALRKK